METISSAAKEFCAASAQHVGSASRSLFQRCISKAPLLFGMVALVLFASNAMAQVSGRSATCGPVNGKTAKIGITGLRSANN